MIKELIKNRFYGHGKTGLLAKNILADTKIVIADIGSTGGLDSKWQPIHNYLMVYAFDPDERAFNRQNNNLEVINTALWSSQAILKIYLTKFPSASSVFEPNTLILNKFLNYDCHEVIGLEEIKAKTLDQALTKVTNIDFIKVDAEGADLQILLGANKFLESTVIGIQTEVQYIERNIGSPFFSDIDPEIRGYGFWLMELKNQSWIRRSNIFNAQSVPQLIWGDAVYMISCEEATKRSRNLNQDDRKLLLKKIIVLAATLKFYDYAFEMIKLFENEELIESHFAEELMNKIKRSMSTNFQIIFSCLVNYIIVYTLGVFVKIFTSKKELIEHLQLETSSKLLGAFSNLLSRHGPNKVAINN